MSESSFLILIGVILALSCNVKTGKLCMTNINNIVTKITFYKFHVDLYCFFEFLIVML